MNRVALALFSLLLVDPVVNAHDVSKTPVTWNREVSRIVYERCVSCHRAGGTAFSLMTYQEARPWAVAIKESVLSRRMPPWGAVKGFGDFRDDQALTQKQVELISDWVDGGIRRGNNPNVLPKRPIFETASIFKSPKDGIQISGAFTLNRSLTLEGLLPQSIPDGASLQIVAELPNGTVEPLVWFYEYKDGYQHPFLFRRPILLPSGTRIRGLPRNASILLIPADRKTSK
jgi:hypothetical protein